MAPSPSKYFSARSTARSGCSNAAAVGSTRTSSCLSHARATARRRPGSCPSTRRRRATQAIPVGSSGRPHFHWPNDNGPHSGRCQPTGREPLPAGSLPAFHRTGESPSHFGITGREVDDGGQAGRNRGFGDHGLGHRRGRGEGRDRGRAAQPRAEHGRRDGRRPREVAGQAGRAGQARSRRARRRARTGARRHRPRRARRVRPRARVDRRGPRGEEAPLHRARPHLPRAHDPRDEHVDAAGRRDGDGDRPPRPGVRHPLLQPGADDGARRGRARDHVDRRHDRRGDRVRDGLRQERRAGEGPGRLHRERAAVPVPQQRGAVCSTPASRPATTSTPR